MDEKALGQRLQLARKRAKLTQQELCQKAGLSYSTLAKIERGAIRSPSVFTVAAIANATNTPIEKLLDLKKEVSADPNAKKRSKNGVSFVYFDVNGTLVRFFERAFDQIAKQSRRPIDQIEMLFWKYDKMMCAGELTNDEVNKVFAKELGLKGFDWQKNYQSNVEVTPHANEMVSWVAEHYEVGLLTNNWAGFTKALMKKKLLPDVKYAAVVESAEVKCLKPDAKFYRLAEELAGVSGDEILLIDDTPAYLTGANKLEWHVLRFDGFHPETSISRVKQALEF